MASKLIYLLMDFETFNKLSALEQVTSVCSTLQTSMFDIFPNIIDNINLNPLTILQKVHLRYFTGSKIYLCR